jgi:hypothetical protein
MKKFASLVLAVLLIATMMVPAAFATSSPKRVVVEVPTMFDLPAPSSDAPDFVYVKSEATTVVKTDEGYKPEDQVVSYKLIVITNWILGSKDLTAKYVSDAPFDKYVSVSIDDVAVPADKLTVVSGSTDVTIDASYMDTLTVGTHSIVIKSTDGQAAGTFTISAQATAGGDATGTAGGTATGTTGGDTTGATGTTGGDATGATATTGGDVTGSAGGAAATSGSTPKTGDDSNTILWAAISLVTLGAIGVVALPLVKKVKA